MPSWSSRFALGAGRSEVAGLEVTDLTETEDGPLFLRVDRHGKLGRSAGRGSEDGRLSLVRPLAAARLHDRLIRSGRQPAPDRPARRVAGRVGHPARLLQEVEKWQDNPLSGIGL
jgi:hypothetical protein